MILKTVMLAWKRLTPTNQLIQITLLIILGGVSDAGRSTQMMLRLKWNALSAIRNQTVWSQSLCSWDLYYLALTCLKR